MKIAEKLPEDFPEGFPGFIVTQSVAELFDRGPFAPDDIVRMCPATLPLTADFNALAQDYLVHHPNSKALRWDRRTKNLTDSLQYADVLRWKKSLQKSGASDSRIVAIETILADMKMAQSRELRPILRVVFSHAAQELLHEDSLSHTRLIRSYTVSGTRFARNGDVTPQKINAQGAGERFVLLEGRQAYRVPLGWYSWHSTRRSELPVLDNYTSVFVHGIPEQSWNEPPRLSMVAQRP